VDRLADDRPTRPPSSQRPRRWILVIAAAAAVGLLGGLIVRAHTGSSPTATPTSAAMNPVNAVANEAPPVVPRKVSAAQLAALPQATTWGVTPAAPRDPAPTAAPDGMLVSTSATVPVYAAPGGLAVAALPAQQLDGNKQPVGPSTSPVIATTNGWAEIMLPSKPNGSVGWVDTDDPHISLTSTPYLIRVDRAHYTLSLWRGTAQIGQWPVGVGILMPQGGVTQSVTPAGRTYVLADIQIIDPTYSPVILPLGTHSPIWDTYGGGPATVGIHTWTPDSTVYGRPSSHGCIRVPEAALQTISATVPIGTAVLIS
jgi:hypothetical protein